METAGCFGLRGGMAKMNRLINPIISLALEDGYGVIPAPGVRPRFDRALAMGWACFELQKTLRGTHSVLGEAGTHAT